MHIRHVDHAWSQRHSDPLGPYALAFLYEQPRGRFTELKAATRLWLAEERRQRRAWVPGEQLAALLAKVNKALASTASFDVRYEFADNVDDGMRPDARFVGLGVSSLDSATASWDDVQQTAGGVGDIFGTAMICLVDGTLMVVEQGARFGIHDMVIQSSMPLIALGSEGMLYPSLHVPAETLLAQGPPGEATARHGCHARELYAMWALNETVWRLDNARIVAAGGPV